MSFACLRFDAVNGAMTAFLFRPPRLWLCGGLHREIAWNYSLGWKLQV